MDRKLFHSTLLDGIVLFLVEVTDRLAVKISSLNLMQRWTNRFLKYINLELKRYEKKQDETCLEIACCRHSIAQVAVNMFRGEIYGFIFITYMLVVKKYIVVKVFVCHWVGYVTISVPRGCFYKLVYRISKLQKGKFQ